MFDLPHDPTSFTMPLGDHLDELRKRIIYALIIPIPLALVLFIFSDGLVEFLLEPLQAVQVSGGYTQQVQVLSPPEFLLTKIKLSLLFALVLTVPWIILQLWLFIAPGLYPSERRFIHVLFPGSIVLTIVGLVLMYVVMLPIMLYVLMSLTTGVSLPPELIPMVPPTEAAAGTATLPVLSHPPEAVQVGQAWVDLGSGTLKVAVASSDPAQHQILSLPLEGQSVIDQTFRLNSYVNFVLLLLLGITIAFQMPLVILLLGWLGVVTPESLGRKRKYALLACAVVAAFTTPADIVSMLMMLLPLYLLYELGIFLLRILPASKIGQRDDIESTPI